MQGVEMKVKCKFAEFSMHNSRKAKRDVQQDLISKEGNNL